MKLTLSHSQAVDRLHEIHERMEEIGAQDTISRAEHREFDRLVEEFDQVNEPLHHAGALPRRLCATAGSGRRIENPN